MDANSLINFAKYPLPVVIVACCGAVCWVAVYIYTIRAIIKHKWVEMPLFLACGNIAWEFLWGFIFYEQIDMGQLFIWSYRVWFLLDIYIFYAVFKYGYKQLTIPLLRDNAHKIIVGLLLMWAAIIYAFVATGVDAPFGAQSSYILNLGISISYILLWLRLGDQFPFYKQIAIFKMIGTAFYTVYFRMQFPENYFVTTIGSVIFIIDNIYIYLLYKYKRTKEVEVA